MSELPATNCYCRRKLEVLLRKADYGLFQTERGVYFLCYLAQPAKLKSCRAAQGQFGRRGGCFILRIPDTSAADINGNAGSSRISSAGAWALILKRRKMAHYIPPPFAPAVQTFDGLENSSASTSLPR